MYLTLHETVLKLLSRMFEPEKAFDVALGLMAECAERKSDGDGFDLFMVLQFGEEPPIMKSFDFEPPSENYDLN